MCGILCLKSTDKITLTNFLDMLNNLQHRGNNSFGYSYNNENGEHISKMVKGLVRNYCAEELSSNIFFGHLRYITSGSKTADVTQPVIGENKFGRFVFVFNGNISLSKYNKLFKTSFTIDTNLIKYYFETYDRQCASTNDLISQFINIFDRAYSIIYYLVEKDRIYMFRDKYGVRPLQYSLKDGEFKAGSELSDDVQEVNAGEVVYLNNDNLVESVYRSRGRTDMGNCLFEYIYFMNKNTTWNNINVESARRRYGEELSRLEDEQIILSKDKYIVIGIPKSGIPSGEAYSRILNIDYKQYIVKNKNIDRTFILNSNKERIKSSKLKYLFNPDLKGRNIIIFDDSIVRGITMKTLVSQLKQQGVLEIHIRIASPKIRYTCEYGIDMSDKNNLLVNKFSNDREIIEFLGCDSLKYLDLDKFKNAMNNYDNMCTGCFNGNYKELEW